MPIQHIKGDIFTSDANLILHQVNCQGVMGGGVALQVRQKYPEVYSAYKALCDQHSDDRSTLLGDQLYCKINDSQRIVNLFAQENFGYDGQCYTDYDALRYALSKVGWFARRKNFSIAIPYLMGCHRGGGDWNIVYKMIEEELAGCDVTLYEYTAG